MKKSYNRWIAIGVIALLAAGVFLYNVLGDKKSVDDSPMPSGRAQSVLPVRGQIVSQQPLSLKLDNIQATLVPDEEVDLSFETSGKITHIYFSEDTGVRKGELLAKINDQPLQAQLKKLEAQLDLAQDRLYRQSALLQKDAVSREAYEQAQTELAMLNADIDLVKANIAQTELRAPFDGVIGFRYVSEGAYANPTTAIARLTKTVPLKLNFSIPEKYMDAVRRGTKINFAVEGSLENFAAEVYAVSSEVDMNTRQLDVKALFPNSLGQLMPGRSAAVSIILYETDNAIVVPAEAVIKEMGIDKVYVYRSGLAQPLSIEAGERTDAQVEVITGVIPGDTLITTGTLQLRQSLPVTLEAIN
ncbi:MAG: efflux RND transporter periplasmic adaptor subunit [Rikenellaceae bacterium]|jgi:membrane fusion protein (multidrug efflux system)|nr:efflux RND transporter periplasmic adaptor subunit [Rikenellaceae bacterium]